MVIRKIGGALVAACVVFSGASATLAWAGASKTKGEFKNLKVLPKNISKDEMKSVMRAQSKGLGVDCDFCHDENDMASDSNDFKLAARDMMKMTAELNAKYFKHADPDDKLQCSTCHRGLPHPPPYVPGENKKILEDAAKEAEGRGLAPTVTPAPVPVPASSGTPSPAPTPSPKPTPKS